MNFSISLSNLWCFMESILEWNLNSVGGFDTAHAAARWESNTSYCYEFSNGDFDCLMTDVLWYSFYKLRAYDRAAIKFRGLEADINFNVTDYSEDLKQDRKSVV